MARRLAVGLVLAALVALPASAGAVTRKQADRAALKALKTKTAPKPYLVTRSPLIRRGTLITSGGPEPEETPPFRVRRAAWAYWQDYDPGAGFVHASYLVVVERSSGKVVHRRTLSWWPALNGGRVPFRARIAGRGPPPVGATPTRALADPLALPAQAAQYPNDCLVMLGDWTEPGLAIDSRDMQRYARDHGFIGAGRAHKLSALEDQIETFRRAGCTDVVVGLFAHSWAPLDTPTPQHIRNRGEWLLTSAEPTMTTDDFVRTAGGQVVMETGQPKRDPGSFTASQLQAALERRQRAAAASGSKLEIKIIVSSCWGGRWLTPGLTRLARVIYAGSQADKTTKFRSDTAPSFRVLLDRLKAAPARDDFAQVIIDAAPGAARDAVRNGDNPTWWDGTAVRGTITSHPPGCRAGIELEMVGLHYVAPDGRRLGWGQGGVTASGRGQPDKTVSFGNQSAGRGSFGPYDCGVAVSLKAMPAPGSAFDHWESEGGCSGTDPVCTGTVAPDRRERAVFRVATRTIRVENGQPQHGHVEGEGINCGDSGLNRHTACTAIVREAKTPSDFYRLDAVANRYRTLRPTVAAIGRCDRDDRLSEARTRCYIKVTGDRTITVTWNPG